MTIPAGTKFYVAPEGHYTYRSAGEEIYPLPKAYRPLVLIDPEDREQVERLIHAYRMQSGVLRDADAWANALREFANPKPEEPLALGAVIEDANGQRWVRDEANDARSWYRRGVGSCRRYSQIDAVRVLSEGAPE